MTASGPSFSVENEYATVLISRVETSRGDRLEIFVPKSGRRVLLDAVQLESLSWQEESFFSELLRGSVGPPEGAGPLP
jgi:hypothetical protein